MKVFSLQKRVVAVLTGPGSHDMLVLCDCSWRCVYSIGSQLLLSPCLQTRVADSISGPTKHNLCLLSIAKSAAANTSAMVPSTATSRPGNAQQQVEAKSSRPQSILVVGKPGLGKTTLLRDVTRVLADVQQLSVIVVDTSLEIGGEVKCA